MGEHRKDEPRIDILFTNRETMIDVAPVFEDDEPTESMSSWAGGILDKADNARRGFASPPPAEVRRWPMRALVVLVVLALAAGMYLALTWAAKGVGAKSITGAAIPAPEPAPALIATAPPLVTSHAKPLPPISHVVLPPAPVVPTTATTAPPTTAATTTSKASPSAVLPSLP